MYTVVVIPNDGNREARTLDCRRLSTAKHLVDMVKDLRPEWYVTIKEGKEDAIVG